MLDKQIEDEYLKLSPELQDSLYKKAQEKLKQPQNPQTLPLQDDSDSLPISEDKLNRKQFVEVIAEQIATNPKFHTYSIDGPWGSGKTKLMEWVKEELDKKYGDTVLTEWFDPWKYESMKNIIFPLIEQLKGKAKGKDFDAKINKMLLASILIGGSIFTIKAVGIKAYLEYISKIPIDKIKGKLQSDFQKLSKLQEDFQDLVDYILKAKTPQPKKMVFLIDDLDRCSPENVVLLLESIKNFLGTEKTCFVFAIDKRIISQGINHKYGSVTDIDGSEYLEKIIQFSFELPSDPEKYAFEFMRFYEGGIASPGYNIQFIPHLFAIANVRSVRLMKKIFNRFILLENLSYKAYQSKFDLPMLFFLTFLYECYPQFYQMILEESAPAQILALIRVNTYNDMKKNAQNNEYFYEKFTNIPQSQRIKIIVDYYLNTHFNLRDVRSGEIQQHVPKIHAILMPSLKAFSMYGTTMME